VASASYCDLHIVVACEAHSRDHIGGPDASRDQAWAPVDCAIPDCASGVIVGVAGTDQSSAKSVDLHSGSLLPCDDMRRAASEDRTRERHACARNELPAMHFSLRNRTSVVSKAPIELPRSARWKVKKLDFTPHGRGATLAP
jgi:hypothetical protein